MTSEPEQHHASVTDRPDVDTLAETVRDALESFPGAPCSCPKHRHLLDAAAALSDLAARARDMEDMEGSPSYHWYYRAQQERERAEASEADREKFREALIRITDKRSGDPSAPEIARCALGWPSS